MSLQLHLLRANILSQLQKNSELLTTVDTSSREVDTIFFPFALFQIPHFT